MAEFRFAAAPQQYTASLQCWSSCLRLQTGVVTLDKYSIKPHFKTSERSILGLYMTRIKLPFTCINKQTSSYIIDNRTVRLVVFLVHRDDPSGLINHFSGVDTCSFIKNGSAKNPLYTAEVCFCWSGNTAQFNLLCFVKYQNKPENVENQSGKKTSQSGFSESSLDNVSSRDVSRWMLDNITPLRNVSR